MKHDRSFRRILTCSDCDGLGRIEVGRRGPNDPDTRTLTCPECDGVGEVCIEPLDQEEDADV